MAIRALLASLIAAASLVPALPLNGQSQSGIYRQWASGTDAPVPASWDQVNQLQESLVAQGLRVVHSDSCPRGLEGLYDHRIGQVLMCNNTMPNRPENHWNTLAHESVHVMQICREGSPLSKGLMQLQQRMLSTTPVQEKLHILSSYPPEQRLYELEARWVANTFPPQAVLNLLQSSCANSAARPPTQTLLPTLLSTSGL